MPTTPSGQRGPYAKGVAKREEILDRTLDVIAREGYRGTSVKELAEAVGLTQAGLLYYFGSKENLFAEVLRKRDERDVALYSTLTDPRNVYLNMVNRNAQVPGLVELFSQMSVEAADPEHPAHEYIAHHGEIFRDGVAQFLADTNSLGGLAPDIVGRLLQAVADGIQLQWLLDPSVDMGEVVEALFTLLNKASHQDDGQD